MELIYQFFADYPLLSLAQTAFMVWMLVDAYRRQADTYWFLIIFFVPYIGAWVYFFVVKAGDLGSFSVGNFNLGALFQRRASLDELRYQAEKTPTFANHLALAQRLIEQHEYDEAIPHLQSALKIEPDHCTALYCLARCHKEQGRPGQAVPLLEALLARDPRWSNYTGWHLLVEARDQAGDRAGALESCRKLARIAPTLEHTCLLADFLLRAGLPGEAADLLDRSLRDHDYSPGPIRRRNRRWASEARRLQKRVEAEKHSSAHE